MDSMAPGHPINTYNGLSEDDEDDEEDEEEVAAADGPEEDASSSGDEAEECPVPAALPVEPGCAAEQRAAGLSRELYQGYRVLRELMSAANRTFNWPFMNAVNAEGALWDYKTIIKEPTWLKKVRDRLLDGAYASLTPLFRELRLMLRNCYRYNGPQHSITRRALRLEQTMEQLIDQMEPDLRDQCTLEATEGPEAVVDTSLVSRRRSARGKKPTYFSHVLHAVRHERAEREKAYRRQQLEARRARGRRRC
ncbi:bromodomain-containing protein 3-like [Pollicipes pollicipes]|uniref:bromodomain-containing protein 3-like n=1 Tax=Pollicipes pollicipes TaxID=41117 RepID=UPI0018856170|nr:bromodomain-containing protein 3-like [Pollicipes pollicipes]XP_037071085.1 bromodomain-containing protein 3-like [Pollicipes pollicipes]